MYGTVKCMLSHNCNANSSQSRGFAYNTPQLRHSIVYDTPFSVSLKCYDGFVKYSIAVIYVIIDCGLDL